MLVFVSRKIRAHNLFFFFIHLSNMKSNFILIKECIDEEEDDNDLT